MKSPRTYTRRGVLGLLLVGLLPALALGLWVSRLLPATVASDFRTGLICGLASIWLVVVLDFVTPRWK